MANENQEVRVSFTLDLADVLAAHRFFFLRSRLVILWLAMSLVVVVALLAIGASSSALAYVVFTSVLLVWSLYFRPRKSFRSNPILNGNRTWLLDPGGISCEISGAEGRLMRSEMDWASIDRVRESSSAFLLATTSTMSEMAFILPKRAFDSSQLADVRTLLFVERA